MAAASSDCRAHSLTVSPLVLRPLPMCCSPTLLALWEGWSLLKLVSVLFPFPWSLVNHPSHLLLITVPLSPHRGLAPQPGAALCSPSLPLPCSEQGWRRWGAEIPIRENGDESTERSWSAAQGWERAELSLVLISERFLGVPAPGLEPPSAITPSPPVRVLSTSSARIAKAETWGCRGAPGVPKPHCEIPSRLLPTLFTRAEFGMARASPHPSSFVPFISAGRWISL